ncbi:Gfo/Idh/MocA family protein [Sphingobacterium griseoflavum]|uniref:Oxidoreductase n=1 Tax=Sphingobacterium griseoflavum TaxID=1474952 RepID=A0ABQ3I388_9SPHI|nr:Gfo/Idh/MocA family oxidoreductase [Sphingobacterium griseoflavum]GHE45944.1 hypothetical protein GCM10017764_31550 [Sphingobacterium griseoflavum]
MVRSSILSIVFTLFSSVVLAQTPLKLAIAGLSHGHVDWIFHRKDKTDIQLVGIFETNPELINRYANKYHLDKSLFYTDLEHMLAEVTPDAVSAFGAVNDHVAVVRACAPKKIHVMVEKPLATKLNDALEIAHLADVHNIEVLTNFETSWYESNQQAKYMLDAGELGDIRKVMVNDGHQGPKEIGVSKEFFQILVDPDKNGAGALIDFGCYGANLMTWLMAGQKPISVTAVVQQNKPVIYAEVDDEASIILQYPTAQCIIQASWNWPFSRKDMEIYGTKGYAIASDATTLRYRTNERENEQTTKLTARKPPFDDPFAVLAAVVQGRLLLDQHDCYGLTVNLTAVAILDAAQQSAAQHKTIYLAQ